MCHAGIAEQVRGKYTPFEIAAVTRYRTCGRAKGWRLEGWHTELSAKFDLTCVPPWGTLRKYKNTPEIAAHMIVSFAHKGLKRLFEKGETKNVKYEHIGKLTDILSMLDNAKVVEDMNAPGLKLHPLKGSEKGIWSVWVSGNWRVTFRFENGDAEVVDYRDYH